MSTRSQKVVIPATMVTLVLALGKILRDHLKLDLVETECWTIEHVTDWGVPLRQPGPTASVAELNAHEYTEVVYGPEEHAMNVYLAKGKSYVRGRGEVQLRVRSEFSEWIPAHVCYWDFQLWIRWSDGEMTSHHFESSVDHDKSVSDLILVNDAERPMPKEPPRKIAFWREQEAQAS